MIGVVIPAHNEENYLAACLQSVEIATHYAQTQGKEVRTVVVLDDCSDNSAEIAAGFAVETLTIHAGNVGIARSIGANYLLNNGISWLACTDADTCVAPDWLVAQLDLHADAVCGSIGVRHWQVHCPQVRSHFQKIYCDRDGHRHIHGANLGISAHAYRNAGGFPPLMVGEDAALINAIIEGGAQIAWSAKPRVFTSARRHARCSSGFADYLLALEISIEKN